MSADAQQLNEGDIASCSSDVPLTKRDVIVNKVKFDYAMKDQNPVDHVHFFANWEDTSRSTSPLADGAAKFKIPKSKISNIIPDRFQEFYVRVYARDPRHVGAVKEAFQNYMRKHFNPRYATEIDGEGFSVPLKRSKSLH